MKKRVFSKVLAFLTAVSLLSTTAFAASFADFQGAINDTGNTNGTQIGDTDHYGYAWNDVTNGWGITAWNQGDVRNVQLNENITYDPAKDAQNKGITVNGGANVSIDMGGNTIDGGYRAEVKDAEGNITQEAAEGNNNSVITVKNSTLTLSNGTITGGGPVWPNGGGINSENSTLTANNVNVTGNKATFGGGIFILNGSFTMTGGSIRDNAAMNNGGGIYTKGTGGQRATVNMTNVTVSNNDGAGYAGGIRTWGTDMTLNNVTVTDNYAKNESGGVLVSSSSHIIMAGGSIADNYTTGDGSIGGGMVIDCLNDRVELTNVRITGNTATEIGGGIYVYVPRNGYQNSLILHDGNEIHSNLAQYDADAETGIGSDIYASEGANVTGLGTPSKAPVGQQFDGWYENGEGGRNEDQYGAPAGDKITESVNLVAGLSPAAPDETPDTPETPDAALPVEGLPAAGAATTTIEDEETPLAGLFTRGDAIGYLWEQSGSPEAELSDFEDVPEDHYWAVAIGWAQDMGIALPDEDGNFRPDDLVLRSSAGPEGELQEFLNRYAVYAGIELDEGELFIELEGAADDIVMGEDAQIIFDEFFAKLDAALKAKAA